MYPRFPSSTTMRYLSFISPEKTCIFFILFSLSYKEMKQNNIHNSVKKITFDPIPLHIIFVRVSHKSISLAAFFLCSEVVKCGVLCS